MFKVNTVWKANLLTYVFDENFVKVTFLQRKRSKELVISRNIFSLTYVGFTIFLNKIASKSNIAKKFVTVLTGNEGSKNLHQGFLPMVDQDTPCECYIGTLHKITAFQDGLLNRIPANNGN